MKNSFVISLLSICTLSCGTLTSIDSSGQRANNQGLREIPSRTSIDTTAKTVLDEFARDESCRSLLIQVISERHGMVLLQGKTLDVRILRSGKSEFDDTENAIDAERRQFEIGIEDLNKLHGLLKLTSVLSLDNKYVAEDACLDATFKKIVIFCPSPDSPPKQIEIKECRSELSDEINPVPGGLTDVIDFTESVKQKIR